MNKVNCFEKIKNYLNIKHPVEVVIDKSVDDCRVQLMDNVYKIICKEKVDAFYGMLNIKAGLINHDSVFKRNFKNLGIMVDLSRNAILNISTIKELIINLSILGYNQLYLYMEDTYEVKGESNFGYLRGRYTHKELKEIDDFAYYYGIEVIPCIQTLAHLNAIFRWPEYKEINDIDDILLVDNERTYELIENMILSLRSCFRTRNIHIGMDEAYHVGLGKYLDKHGYTDRFSILYKHVKRIIEICTKYKFKPMMWSDMFFKLAFSGQYYSDQKIDEKIMEKIPNNIDLVYWDYYKLDSEGYSSMIEKHHKLNSNVIFAGGAWKWTGFAPNNRFSINSSKAACDALIENQVKNVMVTAWGDDGGEASIFSCLPSIVYYSSVCYNGKIDIYDDNLKSIFNGLTGCHYIDFMNLDYANEPFDREEWESFYNSGKCLLYNDLFTGMFDNFVCKGFNQEYEIKRDKLRILALRNEKYSYLFNTLADLCDVLSIKSELGCDIYMHYHNDKNKLTEDCQKILKVISLVEKFYDSFRYQWLKENKIDGFDVQDIRIGGLLLRLKSQYRTLKDYIDGNISSISILDEKIIKHVDKDQNGRERNLYLNNWKQITTPNIL